MLFVLTTIAAPAQTRVPNARPWLQPGEPNIAIVNSYHAGFWWSDEEQRGVIAGLRERWPTIQPVVEYLDLKRFPNLENETNFVNYVLRKYHGVRFDLTIFLDEAGLNASTNHPYLAGYAPIVFCGVGHADAVARTGYTNMTGVIEAPDAAANFRLIRQLLPDVKRVHALCHPQQYDFLRRYHDEVFSDGVVELVPIPLMNVDGVYKYVAALPADEPVLLFTFQTDADRRLVPPEFRRELTRRSRAPVFVHYETGHGIGLGGRILSAFEHGRQAARLALRILDGEPAESIPPIQGEAALRTVFDHEQLARFGIPESRLPADAEVINRPEPLLLRYRRGLYGLGGFAAGLTVLSLFLVRSNSRRRQLFNEASDAIFVTDLRSVMMDVNAAGGELIGHAREKLLGRSFEELVEPEDLARTPFRADEVLRGRPVRSRRRLLRADGTVLVCDCSTSRLGGDRLQKIVRDVSQQERAERALRESEERFRTVAEAVEDIVYEWRPDTDAVWRSKQSGDFLGYPPEETEPTGEWWLRQVHVEDDEMVRSKFRDALSKDATFSFEYRMRHKNGGTVHVWDKGRIIRDVRGRVVKVIGGTTNLTERRELEGQLRQAQKMEAIGTLAGGIAHDFNNILSGVLGNAELLRLDLPGTHRGHESIDEILKATARARDLINQILTFGRRGDEPRTSVNLGPTVREAYRFLRTTIPANFDVRLNSPAELPPVVADATQIYQSLMNLATNAWQAFDSEHGRIEVIGDTVTLDAEETRRIGELKPGRFVRLRVRDDGPGMSAMVRERVFEPFFTTKQLGRGTGLGLSVVHGIVQGHGGSIVVRSEPGQGAEFSIYLPVAAEMPVAEEVSAAVPPPPGEGRRVLLLDDEAMLLRTGGEILRRLGYAVEVFRDANTALARLTAEPDGFDAVLTDLSMPEMSGLEFAENVLRVTPGKPLVLMSGFLGETDVEEYRARGFREVLQKPLGVESLGHALGRIFNPDGVAGR